MTHEEDISEAVWRMAQLIGSYYKALLQMGVDDSLASELVKMYQDVLFAAMLKGDV